MEILHIGVRVLDSGLAVGMRPDILVKGIFSVYHTSAALSSSKIAQKKRIVQIAQF